MTEHANQPEPHGRPDVWAPRLVRILDEQISIYEELLALAESQARLIAEDRDDELIELLGRRQSLVDRATASGRQMEPFTSVWDSLAPELTAEQRGAISGRTSRLDELLLSIAKLDEADRARLEERRTEVGREINAIATKRSAVAAYGGPAQPAAPRYQDRQG